MTQVLERPIQSSSLEATTTRTTCPYCAVQCSFDIAIETGAATAMKPTKDCPVAGGRFVKKV